MRNEKFGSIISEDMKLRLSNIRKVYPNGAIGVDNIDLQVNDGQMTVFLGPSGCGKTTLLRLICGLESPDEGTIFLDGADVTRWEPKRRDIAMVFQNYALYPHMSVKQNLEFGLKARKIPKAQSEESVSWAAGLLGLNELLSRKPKELSGGQRQRVALGRAIVRKPKLYLYDEPLSNLDAELRMRMRGEILALHRRVNGTSIYVTHDQVEAMSLADIIFIIKEGKIVSSGPPNDLYNNPPDLFTAGFLGFPAMNLIEGTAENGAFILTDGLKIPVDGKSVPASESIVLGIRPEDILIDETGDIKGEVISLENLGRSVLLYVKSSSGDEIKIVADKEYHVGERISARFSTDRILFFDKKSNKRVT
ncbi:MAG: ABC transporter ATP-binding protein [candidate division Zixibacteria bacterium]